MKKINSLITIIIIAITTGAMAQESATASSSATIVAPIGIAQAADMNFGNVAVSSADGTVVMTTGGSTSLTGGVTLPNNTGTVTAAAFDVTGESNYTYSITLPSDAITLVEEEGSEEMTVDTFESDPDTTGTLTTGAQTVNVGGILNVTGGQTAGVYTNSTDLTVTVNYN
ncbi:hypothetical protein P700755_003216 [Psychroflexus torquis ATCC 700755]|uniref:DUF4402 domain-containing protein n=1 Tax=Psychroflexus torquis (strain ATCC 700755 / CIP 106069 / ACAM 623) TaxID=313595 RepID=K4ILA5_PSYTT|nr:DUF4402 domain-containing protein [Psychroflexus torquis]AFU69866.1 hypothetical protein P700755_003216 [Psychroflexus torquis ATCC 700755]